MNPRLARLAAGLALAALLVTSALVILLWPESKADRFIDYLDDRGVTYSTREAMLRVADDVCSLQRELDDFNTEEYLRTAFPPGDAMAITYGIENGEYCK